MQHRICLGAAWKTSIVLLRSFVIEQKVDLNQE